MTARDDVRVPTRRQVHVWARPTDRKSVRIDNVDTGPNYPGMVRTQTKAALSVSSDRDGGLRPDAKGSINLRIEAQTRQLIDDAAAVLGKTRTEFMIDSARAQAIDVLLDQRLFVLDPERYDAFMHALDNPPAPGPKLRALLRRTPQWSS